MKNTVQSKTARNKPGVTKTETAKAQRVFSAGEITKAELDSVKAGTRVMLSVDGEWADVARELAKRHGTTPAQAVEAALIDAYEAAKRVDADRELAKRAKCSMPPVFWDTKEARLMAKLSITTDVAKMLCGLSDVGCVNNMSDLLARMIREEYARRHEEEREPVNARRRAAARAVVTVCNKADSLARLLKDTAADLEGQLRKLDEVEAGLRFTVQSVTKSRDAKLRCAVAVVCLAIEGREAVTLRLPTHPDARQYNDTLAFLRAVGDTLPLNAKGYLARPPRPDWQNMAGRSGRCRMDSYGLQLLLFSTDGEAMPFIVSPECQR